MAVGTGANPVHYFIIDKHYRRVGESSRPRQSHKLEIAGANPASATSQFLSMVKWYHSAFGTQERRFDSYYRDQQALIAHLAEQPPCKR